MPTATHVQYLSPAQVCEIVPGMTTNNLRQLRFNGKGPRFFKPTGRRGNVTLYLESDVREWVEASVRTSTADSTL